MTPNGVILGDEPTFDDILHPLSAEAFLAEHYDRKPLHLEGDPGKFAAVMSWDGLTSMLNMTAVWSSSSLQLAHNKDVVPPARYCRAAKNRDGQPVLQPDAAKVMHLLQRGASLVANDIDTLTPALRGVAGALEGALCGKAQANLYCSWKQHEAFATHFDTHDVYAIHIAGEKLWRIYETRAEAPIAHPQFKSYGQEWHDANRGGVAQEILMRPGDLLYLPRGQYHDAIATSDGTIHIAFGVTQVIGMDVIELFAGMAVNDPLFRRNMPRPTDGETDAGEWLAGLGDRLAAYARTPDAVAAIRKYRQEFRYPRAGFDLPVTPTGERYRMVAKGLKAEQRDGSWILTGPRGSVPIPEGFEGPVSWIVGRTDFARDDLVDAFPAYAQSELETLLKDLAGMKVVSRGA